MNDELGFLEKIDEVRYRTGLGFESARNLLEEADWSILQALTDYEAQKGKKGPQIVDKIKAAIGEGNKTAIVIKTNRDTVAELPVTAGVVGAVFAPKLALLGAAACLLTRCSFHLRKRPSAEETLIDN
ncbi:MAG TPA: DUF4342 domain-containing protein [Firmicutes bacterium]|nr:DUF4342 domain-containing protein [Bacillota bacterium]